MGLCKTSIFSIFTFINASDLKFCPRSYISCVYLMFEWKSLQNDDVSLWNSIQECSDPFIGNSVLFLEDCWLLLLCQGWGIFRLFLCRIVVSREGGGAIFLVGLSHSVTAQVSSIKRMQSKGFFRPLVFLAAPGCPAPGLSAKAQDYDEECSVQLFLVFM